MNNVSTEPVVDGAKVVATVVGIVGAVATILVIVGVLGAADVPGLVGATASIATGIVTLVGIVAPLWKAKTVRELVAPMVNVAAIADSTGTIVAGPASPHVDGTVVDVVPSVP